MENGGGLEDRPLACEVGHRRERVAFLGDCRSWDALHRIDGRIFCREGLDELGAAQGVNNAERRDAVTHLGDLLDRRLDGDDGIALEGLMPYATTGARGYEGLVRKTSVNLSEWVDDDIEAPATRPFTTDGITATRLSRGLVSFGMPMITARP